MASKKSEQDPAMMDPNARVDGLFAAIFAHAQKEIGDQLIFGANATEVSVGIPLPALCLEYLLYSTCWPLSRVATLVGQMASGKTALGFEISRWHHTYGGGSAYIDCEHKDASHVRTGMYRHNPNLIARAATVPCYLMEDAQKAITGLIKSVVKAAAEAGVPRTIPTAILLDSLVGNVPDSEAKDVAKNDGAAKKGHPISALLITRYFRFIQKEMETNPISLLATNHLRIGTDQMGNTIRTTPGGTSVPFFETIEIEMKKLGGYDLATHGGLSTTLKMYKNCVGPAGRSITADLIWWWVDVRDSQTGELVLDEYGVPRRQQHFAWDWDTATIQMLRNIETHKPSLFTSIQNHACDLHFVGSARKGDDAKVWSHALGIPESSPVIHREAGRILHSNPAAMSRLRYQLDIMQMPAFQPGRDYRAALQAAQEEAQRRVESTAPQTVDLLLPPAAGEPDPQQVV